MLYADHFHLQIRRVWVRFGGYHLRTAAQLSCFGGLLDDSSNCIEVFVIHENQPFTTTGCESVIGTLLPLRVKPVDLHHFRGVRLGITPCELHLFGFDGFMHVFYCHIHPLGAFGGAGE